MSGRVCSIHQEWCPTGACRWCEPLPQSEPDQPRPIGVVTGIDLARGIVTITANDNATASGWNGYWIGLNA